MTTSLYPSIDLTRKMMKDLRNFLFPDYFGAGDDPQPELCELAGKDAAESLMKRLPEIKILLLGDAEAMARNDPAAEGIGEVILCYPFMVASTHYRIAHELLNLGVKFLPRLITELAHSATGIDIHPAAKIGRHFCIDHGTGVVIGATTIIGDNVMLYQGVTLGAKNFKYDKDGRMIDEPRHPVLEDNVTVYSNTSILGRVRIGHDTVIGGNVWLTRDIPACSRILQRKAVSQKVFNGGEGI